jgi:hypothetical protein
MSAARSSENELRGGLLMNARNESLPWLEAVEDENDAPRLSARKMLAALALVLLAAAVVAGTLFWLGRQGGNGGSGPPELIRAEPGPYKVKPADPGGLDVTGESATAYATGAGEDPDAELDLGALPEEPIVRPQPKAVEPPPGQQPQPVPPAAAPAGPSVQLGFYPSEAAANASWESLSKRFPALAGASKIVVPYQSGFRLRAGLSSSAEATRACQLLKVAGEACFVVR